MKKLTIYSIVFAISVSLAGAQNIDPTVEVSRAYEGKLMEVHKPAFEMSVPDTVYRFDLDFDYSVFTNPYKGAYEFRPYMTRMKPASESNGPSSFYLKAGAGYTLHPVFDVLWSPELKRSLSIDVYGQHRSYVGPYRALQMDAPWNGHDLLSNAGVDFGYDWKRAALDFGASYYGIVTDDYLMKRAYNALDAYLAVKSKTLWKESFVYDISLAYRYAADRSPVSLSEQNILFESSFGPDMRRRAKVSFDVDVELASYSGAFSQTLGRFCLVPRYVLDRNRLRLDVGLRIEASMVRGGSGRTGQIVYPDIRLDLSVIQDAMKLYVDIAGGESLNTYSSLLASNHHVNPGYAPGGGYASFLQSDIERVNARVGIEGRVTSFFSYNLRGGYVNGGRGLFDAVVRASDGKYMPAISYASYQRGYAAVDWDLNVQSFRFDGTVMYDRLWGVKNAGEGLVVPSALSGDVSVAYNWKKRIYVGADCGFATSRSTGLEDVVIPAFADLGINAEYVMNRMVSFWARGGNLLNMEIQRNVLFAEKGINFTAGICLNF